MNARNRVVRTSVVGVLFLIGAASGDPILYVDVNATGPARDGSSWCEAYTDLQEALAFARNSGGHIDEIRVADGVYKPGDPGDRRDPFELINGVALLGGYAGCGAVDADERDVIQFETVLSGDLKGDDGALYINRTDNSEYVVRAEEHVVPTPGPAERPGDPDATARARIEGFTIRGGGKAGMRNDTASPTIVDCVFKDNSYSNTFGGYSVGLSNFSSSPDITRCTFAGNAGRGMSSNGGGGTLTVTDSTFRDGPGGGMSHVASGDVTLIRCTFADNIIGDGYDGEGGGLLLDEGRNHSTLIDCTFTGNSAYSGGGLYIRNSRRGASLQNCTFRNNSARSGGGLYVRSGDPNNPAVATLTNCLFEGNVASVGGGLKVDIYTQATLANCMFRGNSAGREGGGMAVFSSGASLTNCIFQGNTAGDLGGGILYFGNNTECLGCGVSLTNCTLYGNYAGETGGGLSLLYPTTRGTAALTNSIVWGNTSGCGSTETAQIGIPSGWCDSPAVNYSCVQGWTGQFAGFANINQDPLFVDAEAGDFHLSADSPCIGIGDPAVDPASALLDLDAEPRVQGCRVDMGADETSVLPRDDCDGNGVADACQVEDDPATDCNVNLVPDACELAANAAPDCNANGVLDSCDVAAMGSSSDCDGNGVPDECDPDCNGNGVPDSCEISLFAAPDCNLNGVPDDCEPDCNGNGIADGCDVPHTLIVPMSPKLSPIGENDPQSYSFGMLPESIGDVTISVTALSRFSSNDRFLDVRINETSVGRLFEVGGHSCQQMDVGNPGVGEIVVSAETFNAALGGGDAVIHLAPSEGVRSYSCCESYVTVGLRYDPVFTSLDCNDNGVPDECEVADGTSGDCNDNGVPDDCEDCNRNHIADECDVAENLSQDCNANGVPDECEDCNVNGIADECETGIADCNLNAVPDECEADADFDGIIDDCDRDDDNDGVDDNLDNCPFQHNPLQADCDGDGLGDACEDPDEPCVVLAPPLGFEVVDLASGMDLYGPPRINECGEIVVSVRLDSSGQNSEVFLYDNGNWTRLTNNDAIDSGSDINDHGTIVWTRRFGQGDEAIYETILRDVDGTETVLDFGEGRLSLNNLGHIAWDVDNPDAGAMDIYFYDGSRVAQIVADGASNQSVRLNDRGEMVWTRYSRSRCDEDPWSQTMLFSDGVITALPSTSDSPQGPDINDNGRVVWTDSHDVGVWHDGVGRVLTRGRGPAINNHGDIAFHRTVSGSARDIWLYSGGVFYRITDPADELAYLSSDINDSREVAWWWHSTEGLLPSGVVLMRRIRTGDIDLDDDVDRLDFASFPGCFTGPGSTDRLCACRFLDIDHDRDVDSDDFALFLESYTGPLDDCDDNGVLDFEDILFADAQDCNLNGILDSCEEPGGASAGGSTAVQPVKSPSIDASAAIANRYLRMLPGNDGMETAIRLTLADVDGFSAFNRQTRWVGPPSTFPDEGADVFVAARLQCEPHFMDWTTVGALHVFGSEIVPGSLYDVQEVDVGCAASLDDDVAYSSPATTIRTAVWGDVAEPFAGDSSAGVQPDFSDIAAVVAKFTADETAPPKSRAQLQPSVPDPSSSVDFSDIAAVIGAFAGQPYPFAGPSSCP